MGASLPHPDFVLCCGVQPFCQPFCVDSKLIERERHAVRCLCTLSLSGMASLSLTRSFVLPLLGQNFASLESLQHAVLAAAAHCLSSQGRLNSTQHTNITCTPVRLLLLGQPQRGMMAYTRSPSSVPPRLLPATRPSYVMFWRCGGV